MTQYARGRLKPGRHGLRQAMPCILVAALGAVAVLHAGPLTAQSAAPVPRTSFQGPTLEFDFPGMRIGVAEYEEGPTGTTVFHFPEGVMAAADVRGGAPGTIATDFLRLAYTSAFVDAIVFAGGSSYGLAAATGAADAIRVQRAEAGRRGIATVPGAIIFDVGDRRFNMIVPDEALGRAALVSAVPNRFPLGARGAGRFAMHSGFYGRRQHSGQGAAFREIGPVKIAVFTIVNALGTVVDREGRVVRCSVDATVDCGLVAGKIERALATRTARAAGETDESPSQNTTLTLVVINQRMDFWALQRLAVQVHTSLGRAIQPFHTQQDGDVLFAVSTGAVQQDALAPATLSALASELAWDAVLASVPPLPARDTSRVAVAAADLAALAGEYDFGFGARLSIAPDGTRLLGRASGTERVYGFEVGEAVELVPSTGGEFFTRGALGDRLRFIRDAAGSVTQLILNPGAWQLSARRIP